MRTWVLVAVAAWGGVAAEAMTAVRQTDISEDTTWGLNGSPYYIYGDLYVVNGATLTILAGVEVRFVEIHGEGGYEDGAELVIRNGALETHGTTGMPVLFTSANESKEKGDWGAIVVENSNQCLLDGAVVEFAKNGLRLYYVTATGASRSSTEGTIIRWSLYNGVLAYYSTAHLYHITLEENDYAGIKTVGNCSVSARNSDLCHNGMYNFYNAAPGNVDAADCWWGTTSPGLIELRIYDKHDNPSCGAVDYTPYLSAPWREGGNIPTYSLGFLKTAFR